MAKVAIDCDGVLADFVKVYVEFANRRYPGRTPKEWVNSIWDFDEMFTKAEQDLIWRDIKATPNFWLSLPAYSDSVGALARWLITHYNQDVFVCTSRVATAGMTVAQQTEMWILSCGVKPIHNYMGVLVAEDSSTKWQVYAALGIGWSLDDKASTVRECEQVAGHRAYLLRRPWNQGEITKRAVGSVEEFLKEIKDGE